MAKTYKFGNGTWATKKNSTLAYSDTNNAFKPLPFSFERNSIATRVNKEGLIEVVSNDVPRIDYTDSADGALLLENSRSNLYTYSEDFGIGTYTSSLITYSSNTLDVLSPKGDNSSDKFTVTTSSGDANRRITKSISVQDFTASIYVKGEVGQKFHLFVARDSYAELKNGYFTCNGEWQRFSFSDTFSTTSTSVVIGLEFGWTSDDSIANDIYYLWGAQLEQGNLSSYIPTNGSTVQRAAETCNGSGNSEVFNDSEGVLMAEISALDNGGLSKRISLTDESGTVNNRVSLELDEIAGTVKVFMVSNSVLVGQITITNINQTQNNKIAIKYNISSLDLYINGFLQETNNTISSMPIGLSSLFFSESEGSFPFYGNTKEIAYYDTVLTDEELEYMTSYRSLNEMVTELNLNAL